MSPPPLVSEEDARKRTGSRLTSVIRPGSPTSAHQVLLSSVLGPPGAPTVLTGAKGSEAARKSLDGSDFEVVIPHQDPRLSSAAVSGTGPSCPAPRALRPLQAPPPQPSVHPVSYEHIRVDVRSPSRGAPRPAGWPWDFGRATPVTGPQLPHRLPDETGLHDSSGPSKSTRCSRGSLTIHFEQHT